MAGGVELATAYVSVIPTMKGRGAQLSRELTGEASDAGDKAGRQAGTSLNSSFSSAVVGLGNVAWAGVAAGVGIFAAAVGSYIPEAIDASDATDKFKATLDFAGLDTGKIDSLVESTQAYADATVYSLGDIQNITAQLASNGVEDYDKLAEAAGNLNAVAGGNAETFSSVGMVLTQTAGQGKLTTENWNQLADAIPGAAGPLMSALEEAGAYTGNFRDAMSEGQITADEFNTALMDLGMTDAAQEAATSTDTIEGAWGNLEATITGALAGLITEYKPQITEFLGTISGLIGPAIAGIGSAISTVAPYIASFFGWFAENQWALAAVAGILGGAMVVAFAAWTVSIWPAVAANIALTAALLANPVTWIIVGIVALIAALVLLIANWDTVVAWVQSVWGTAVQWLKDTFSSIGTWFVTKGQQIAAFLSGLWNGIKTRAVTIWTALVTWVKGVPGKISAGLAALGTTVKSNVSTWVNNIKAAAQEKWNALVTWVQNIPSRISTGLSSLGSTVKSNVSGWVADIKTAATDKFDDLVEWVKGIPGKITTALGDMGSLLYNAGAQIISGFLDGLKSGWDNVTGWVGGIGTWIADNKGPKAYDLALLVPAGQWIMQGLQSGLESEQSNLGRTLQGVSDVIAGQDFAAAASVSSASAAAGMGSSSGAPLVGQMVVRDERTAVTELQNLQRRQNTQSRLFAAVV